MENLHIRKAVKADTPRLKEVFAAARQFMVETGNPTQWTDGYPSDELLQADIDSGDCYTIANDGEHIVATFVLRPPILRYMAAPGLAIAPTPPSTA